MIPPGSGVMAAAQGDQLFPAPFEALSDEACAPTGADHQLQHKCSLNVIHIALHCPAAVRQTGIVQVQTCEGDCVQSRCVRHAQPGNDIKDTSAHQLWRTRLSCNLAAGADQLKFMQCG